MQPEVNRQDLSIVNGVFFLFFYKAPLVVGGYNERDLLIAMKELGEDRQQGEDAGFIVMCLPLPQFIAHIFVAFL